MSITNPLVDEAVASFADLRLSDNVLQALARMGIETPTPIQAAALPPLLDGRDVIGQARTGSGKTLAFGIPAVEIVDPRLRLPQVLVLTPTRELAVQVGGVLEELGKAKGAAVALIFGGRAMGPQREELRRGVQVVVGTPGRVLDLLNQGALRLDKIRFLVLDEADEMLDRGFAPDVERIMGRATPDRQTALFSATMPDWVRKTADKHLDRPVVVAVDPNPEDAAPIEHVAFDVPGGDKLAALKELLDHRGEGSIIVFGRTKHGVKKLARQLEGAGYPVAALQGNLSQNARDRVMEDFRSGATPILLATNVAARGLDVDHVERVINMELPESPELLTHRIGRTGRMGRRGQAITLLGADDGAKWRQLERGLARRIPRVAWRGAKAAIAGGGDEAPAAEIGEQPRSLDAIRSRVAAARGPATPTSALGSAPRGRGPRPTAAAGDGRDATRGRAERPAAASGRYARRQPVGDSAVDRLETAAFARDPRRPSWVDRGTEGGGSTAGRPATNRRTRHRIGCADCGKPAEVPFRPDPTRPVYCDDCFRGGGRGRRRSSATVARA